MAYEPMHPGTQNNLYIYIFMVPFSIIMTILMFARWRSRKTYPTMMMMAGFFTITVAITVFFLGYMQMYITGYKMEFYRFSLAFGYSALMVANIFLILFSKDIFSIDMKYVRKYLVINFIIAILVALPYNYYGVLNSEIHTINIRPYTSILLVVFSILTYTRIAQAAFSNSKKMDASYAKIGFKLIGYSQISLILFFLFLMFDTLWVTTYGGGYTIFTYFAWVMAALFFINCYLGLIMPRWFKKRFASLRNELE